MEVFVRLRHSVCYLSTKEHKSKSAAITQNCKQGSELSGFRIETMSSESRSEKRGSASVEFANQTGDRILTVRLEFNYKNRPKLLETRCTYFESIFYEP